MEENILAWCRRNGFSLIELAPAWAVVVSPGGTVSRMPLWCFWR